ncbi:MAG TPA: PQQ-dependent sugar dehydrogenase [Steroidobacteraceae bacterium]|nr:PQQ-dependent sugar dehydrogenase [Steroidobacteraceae bacterium]
MSPVRSRVPVLFAVLCCALGSIHAAHAATLPSGFAETRVATGLASPTAMAVAPDGRVFIAQQGGALRVVSNGALLTAPFVTLSVNSSGERGLLGVAFDPNFPTNNFVYVYYTTSAAPIHNRVSRFTASAANPNVAAAGSEVQLLNLPNLSSATNHNGGAIHFGTDGKLYIAVGDNANSGTSQPLTTPLGKFLRMNADGSTPSDNPFLSQTTGINQLIFARGLRNPFNFAIDRTNGRIHLNDVGQDSWEEVNHAIAGANFGWPQTEGPNPPGVAGIRYPVHSYQNAGSFCAITGAAFYQPATATFPSEYAGRFFFGDFCGGFIRMLSPPNYTTSAGFATGINSLVDIQVHPDGSLYYLARGGGELFRVQYTASTAPSISSQPTNVTVAAGQSASFTVAASGTAPLSYQWQRNGVNIANATSATYTFVTAAADSGATFRAIVSNAAGSVTSNSATLTVLSNNAPTGSITAPISGANYRGGQTFTFAGTGTDAEDGNLPPSAYTWRVDFHHDDHSHPHVAPTSGITTGTFTIANRGETSANVFYRVILTVRDSSGLTHTSSVDVQPLTSVVRIESNVANAQLTLDGSPITAPFSFTGVEGIIRTLGVVTPQTIGGIAYDFVSWSDGGQATHEITTPNEDTTFTALFQPAATTTLFSDTFETALGWTLTAGANSAPRGRWQRGNPQATTFNGVTLQLTTCDGPSVNCFVTGLSAGSAVGSGDVDEGMTSVQSPVIALPAGGTTTLRFRYYLAHNNNATSADYFRVRVVGNNGQPQTLFTRPGTAGVRGGVWTTQTVNLSAFAGQTVRLRFEAADAAAGSIIEAGFDNVTVTRQ